MMPDDVTLSKMVREFRALLDETEAEDGELKRFLIGKNYDMKEAMEAFSQSRAWRSSIRFEEALDWEITEYVRENTQFHIDGRDKDGRIALYIPIGRWEARKLIQAGLKADLERMMYKTMAIAEKIIDASEFEKFVIVADLAELSYWKVAHYETMQITFKILRAYEQNFPERLESAVIINAPWVLNTIFPAVKPYLSEKTWQRIQIFDSKSNKYTPAILDLIPQESFPTGVLEVLDKTFLN